MLELKSPLARVLDGPAMLIQRLTNFVAPHLQAMTADSLILAMADGDPEYLAYLNSEGLLGRRQVREEESFQR